MTPPTVTAVRVGSGEASRFVVRRCPFCGSRHVHAPEEGHRIAHCPPGVGPPDGYILEEVESWK